MLVISLSILVVVPPPVIEEIISLVAKLEVLVPSVNPAFFNVSTTSVDLVLLASTTAADAALIAVLITT